MSNSLVIRSFALKNEWFVKKKNSKLSPRFWKFVFTKERLWAICSRHSLTKIEIGIRYLEKSESLFHSSQKRANRSKNQRAKSQPWFFKEILYLPAYLSKYLPQPFSSNVWPYRVQYMYSSTLGIDRTSETGRWTIIWGS